MDKGLKEPIWHEYGPFPGIMDVMGRRNSPTRGARRGRAEGRPLSLGSHWRADGAPKAAFRSQQEALRAANVQQLESGIDLHVYECDFCARWHLGSSRARKR